MTLKEAIEATGPKTRSKLNPITHDGVIRRPSWPARYCVRVYGMDALSVCNPNGNKGLPFRLHAWDAIADDWEVVKRG